MKPPEFIEPAPPGVLVEIERRNREAILADVVAHAIASVGIREAPRSACDESRRLAREEFRAALASVGLLKA